MAITKRNIIDRREVLEDGTIQARQATIIEEDGVEISRSFTNRMVFRPGEDVSSADASIQRLATTEHTPEVIEAYEAWVAAHPDRA
jgi:hypothetical protein